MTESKDPAKDPLRSVHTNNFPELLRQLGASVLVTTYGQLRRHPFFYRVAYCVGD